MDNWYRIKVNQNTTSGEVLADIIKSISLCVNKAKYIHLYAIEGGGIGMPLLNDNEDVLPINSVIEACKQINQFDWGDFVFVEDVEDSNPYASYVEIISKSLSTVRAIDSGDFEVFTQNQDVVNELVSQFPGSIIEKGELSSFDYPE